VSLSCNLGTLTSWNPLGHSRPVTGLLYLFYLFITRTRLPTSVCPKTYPPPLFCSRIMFLESTHVYKLFLQKYLNIIVYCAFFLLKFSKYFLISIFVSPLNPNHPFSHCVFTCKFRAMRRRFLKNQNFVMSVVFLSTSLQYQAMRILSG
jgi:hypothetical protein